jgi:hypothetical protein
MKENLKEEKQMNKKMLVLIALVIALAMLTLSACGGSETTTTTTAAPEETTTEAPEETTTEATEAEETGIAAGRFEITVPGAEDLETYIKFNGDGTYYAFFFGGGVIEAGTYEVVDEAVEYFADAGADGDYATAEDNTVETSEQAVVFTSYEGKTQTVAYVDNELRDMELGGMSSNQTAIHNPEFEYDPANEQAVVVRQYFFDGQEGASLTLYHNKTFVDYTGEIGDEGTWEMNDDGSFTLTSTENDDAEYTLTGDQAAASYEKGSETLELSATAGDAAVMVFEVKEIQVGLPMPVDMRLDLMADGSVKAFIYVAAVDADLEVDAGTYTVADIFNYTFTFETAGEIAGEADFATATESSVEVNVPYKADVTADFQGTETPMSIDTVLNGVVTVG